MPPWHIDKTVGIQQFKNDISLSDEQIDTIARWVDARRADGRPEGSAGAARSSTTSNEWKLAKQFGEPELVIKATPYTMDAQTQDKWWKPLVDTGVTEVALGARRRDPHVDDRRPPDPAPRGRVADSGREARAGAVPRHLRRRRTPAPTMTTTTPPGDRGAGLFSEWAIGKVGDVYREGAGKMLVPGSKISWDIHMSQAMNATDAKPVTAEVELGVYLYPRGYTPKYRTVLTNMGASRGRGIDIPPNTIAATQGFTVLSRGPARLENFQPHMHLRGKAMALEAILPNGQRQMISFVNNFQFNWMNSYEYTDDAAPIFPKGTIISVTAWHDNTPRQQEQSRSDAVGRRRRSQHRRDGARLGQRHLSERRRLQGGSREAEGRAGAVDATISSSAGASGARDRHVEGAADRHHDRCSFSVFSRLAGGSVNMRNRLVGRRRPVREPRGWRVRSPR